MKKKIANFSVMVLVAFTACKKEETKSIDKGSLVSAYDSLGFNTNRQAYATTAANFNDMVTELKKGRTIGGIVSETALNNFYTGGSPTLKSITSTFYNAQLIGSNGWFTKAANASGGGSFNPDSAGSQGAYGGYLFDADGFEPEQLIEKGMFGSTLINEALKLLRNNPTLAQVDQALFLIGATPHFKSSNNTNKHGTAADRFFATYIARRDKNDGNGFYTQFKNNFIKLQAAVKAGNNASVEEAVNAIADILEKANAATIINYCHTAVANLSLTSLTDAQKASTLHAIAECHGFALGWKTLTGKKITDAQIDEIMNLLNAPVTGGGKPVMFLTDRVNQISKLQTVITTLQGIYGFSNLQVEDFKKNWINEQNR
jgi:hypothetical protein